VPKNSTESHKETPEEQDARIDSMLNCMVVEASLFALENMDEPPKFTRQEIADFCGCSKDTIRRIEERALRKMEKELSR
jgi:DNA-directed RNA polymerase specialized sigma24 family protein